MGQEIQDALHRFAPRGNVLEIASGTGAGTRHLIKHATSVTALDS
jgi:16S rRNA A1518/A1519 N6-dimethyltransferase RsmA/KsgA/DIM1 with predicted DNA glycosylase/AP lyase activity